MVCTHTTRPVSLSIPACVNPMIQLGFYLPQIYCSRKIPVALAQVPLEYHQEPSGQCKHLLEFHANFATWPWLCASYWFCSQLCAKKCHIILGSALLQSAVGISVSCTPLIAALLFYFTCHFNLRRYTCYYPLLFFFFLMNIILILCWSHFPEMTGCLRFSWTFLLAFPSFHISWFALLILSGCWTTFH